MTMRRQSQLKKKTKKQEEEIPNIKAGIYWGAKQINIGFPASLSLRLHRKRSSKSNASTMTRKIIM